MIQIFVAILCLNQLVSSELIPNRDVCQQLPVSGRCKGYFLKYFFNLTSEKCEQFVWSGCDGNLNRFDSFNDCAAKCQSTIIPQNNPSRDVCQLSARSGTCRGFFVKYFFNKLNDQCEQFVWSGCDGNLNRFDTLDQCLNSCKPNRQISDTEKCSFHADSGPCMAYFERYFYNKTSSKCERFIYGGCLGNSNRFETKETCEKACSPQAEEEQYVEIEEANEICGLTRDVGPCRALMPRWYFSTITNRCESFSFGGCRGNRNNFLTQNECEMRCNRRKN